MKNKLSELAEFMFYLKESEKQAKTNKGFFKEDAKNFEHWKRWEQNYEMMQSVLSSYLHKRQEFINLYGAYMD